MESKFKKSILFCLIIFVSLSWGSRIVWAATPVPEKESVKPAGATQPPEPAKKAEKFIVKDREYCYECIDNSDCLGCHTKISERKFAQSVHGANSCNSCHYDITDVKTHTKAKGARIHAEPVTCHRCHAKTAIKTFTK
ncbi:MAG: cbcY [Deltaproteobacteria bacterium]|nr:cbcY [Deltaproteobacteria bacterium]